MARKKSRYQLELEDERQQAIRDTLDVIVAKMFRADWSVELHEQQVKLLTDFVTDPGFPTRNRIRIVQRHRNERMVAKLMREQDEIEARIHGKSVQDIQTAMKAVAETLTQPGMVALINDNESNKGEIR
jgi:hypothetical protein